MLLVGLVIGYTLLPMFLNKRSGFQDSSCDSEIAECPPMPDMTKYVLKSSIPPPHQCPDMDDYMLKTECPPVPDMSQYVLKASIPKLQPVIVDTSSSKKCGDCPACPRPRCPEVKCPPPTVCPACPACPRPSCPDTVVKCKSESAGYDRVRPYLTPLSFNVFGQ
jgi:hypothetical protein